jgi:hypothetical protein
MSISNIKQPLEQVCSLGQKVINAFSTETNPNYIGEVKLIEKKRYVKGVAYLIEFKDIKFWVTGRYILKNKLT